MAAASTDELIKGAVNWTGALGAGGVSDAVVTTVPLISSISLPSDTAVEITIDRVDANGTATPTKREVVKGVVSGNNIIDCIRGVEGTAQAHSGGAVVEVMLTADMWDSIIDNHLSAHNQDGTHKITALDAVRYAADAGSTDAYAITLSPVPSAYYTGMVVNFKANTANTTTASLNVNGLGAKTIKKNVDSDLVTGDILAGQFCTVIYDGTNFQLINNSSGDESWKPYSAVVPTRASADDPTYVLTFASVDLTSILSVGKKIKWTQNSTVRYGIITAITFSTNTTVTLYGGTDYDVEDTATYTISDFNYSSMKAPTGFPLDPDKWTLKTTDTTIRQQTTPTQNTWYNLGSLSLSMPIGCWRAYYYVIAQINDTTTQNYQLQTTLSTANNSESDGEMTSYSEFYVSTAANIQCIKEKNITVTSKTTYYLNTMTPTASVDNMYNRGDVSDTIIKFICAYL
jgi:hypothetical protein